eukprot:TRINITY_DN5826_c0_g1_i1.p1 TRINITY_DN5826_c0_g1~~TRINITY_DN5826_c0_g1_i1.p1  ORF type:complete len:523 (-),score=137.61 TRINITY_DN5826_c0_g1_i1:169-1560(-)
MEEMKSCNPDKCPIDCAMADWGGWSACTAKCGGGLMERARDITTEPQHGGEPCEEAKEAKSCNLQSCDVDCELSDWTPWGDCSKACNSGEQERKKTIVTQLQGDGSCPAIRDAIRLEARPCNDKPCKNDLLGFKCFKFTPTRLRNNGRANSVQLSDLFLMGDHGPISMRNAFKASNPGGRSPRNEEPRRSVDENPQTKWLDFNKGPLIIESTKGPVKVSSFRWVTANDATERDPMGWKMEGSVDCGGNWQMLHQINYYNTPGGRFSPTEWFNFPVKPLRCRSEIDLVMLLDGSGSLDSNGWKMTIAAAKMLAQSFMEGGKVNVAALVFGTKAEWIQHFSTDLQKTLGNLDEAKWPKGGTKTSEALNMANAELSLGRPDAQSVVLVITNGAPLSPKKTLEASKAVRKTARLMWAPVTEFAPLAEMKEMASYPKEDNLFPLKDYNELPTQKTNDAVVSSVCKELF